MSILRQEQCQQWEQARGLTAAAIRWIVEEGGRIYPCGMSPAEATAAWLQRLRADYAEYEDWLRDCPGAGRA